MHKDNFIPDRTSRLSHLSVQEEEEEESHLTIYCLFAGSTLL